MNIIELIKISKAYSGKQVLNELSLEIQKGEFVAIMGESGKGKSTLLNIIGCLEEVDSGDVIIDGEKNIKPNSSKANKVLREKIGYLFQNFALIDQETVKYNLELVLKYSSKSKKEIKSIIEESLAYVGLENYEKKKIYELSGGEAQRVSLARLMLKPSKIILADEPTGSLDEENVSIVLDFLKTLNKNGKTIIIVTHDKNVANKCDRIIKL